MEFEMLIRKRIAYIPTNLYMHKTPDKEDESIILYTTGQATNDFIVFLQIHLLLI